MIVIQGYPLSDNFVQGEDKSCLAVLPSKFLIIYYSLLLCSVCQLCKLFYGQIKLIRMRYLNKSRLAKTYRQQGLINETGLYWIDDPFLSRISYSPGVVCVTRLSPTILHWDDICGDIETVNLTPVSSVASLVYRALRLNPTTRINMEWVLLMLRNLLGKSHNDILWFSYFLELKYIIIFWR